MLSFKRRHGDLEDMESLWGSMTNIYELKLQVKVLNKEKMKALAEAAKLQAKISAVELIIAEREMKLEKRAEEEKENSGRAYKKRNVDHKDEHKDKLKHQSSQEGSEKKVKTVAASKKSSKVHKSNTASTKSKCIQSKVIDSSEGQKSKTITTLNKQKTDKDTQTKETTNAREKTSKSKIEQTSRNNTEETNKTLTSKNKVSDVSLKNKQDISKDTVLERTIVLEKTSLKINEPKTIIQERPKLVCQIPVTKLQKIMNKDGKSVKESSVKKELYGSQHMEITNMLFNEIMAGKVVKKEDGRHSINSFATLILISDSTSTKSTQSIPD